MLWPVTLQDQLQEIAKTWDIFPVEQDNPIHLRAIWGKGVPGKKPVQNITFTAAKYPDVAGRKRAFEDKAINLNQQGYNIYTCLNVIKPEFAGDELNELAVKDADILHRRYLLIDVDRSITNEPATDDEIESVNEVTCRIETNLFFNKGHWPVTVFSGNGNHIYLPIDLPNNVTCKVLCQKVLQALANQYDTTTVEVDTSVYNASRITKVPGTVARKGVEVPDPTGFNERFYRMASLVT